MKKAVFVLIAVLVFILGCGKAIPALIQKGETGVLWDGFESDLFWAAGGTDDDCSQNAVKSNEFASEGKNSLKCTYALTANKGATFLFERNENWLEYKGLGVDFNNAADEDIRVAFILCTGSNWMWQESKTVVLTPGKTLNVRFNFFDNNFKTAATNWEIKASIVDIGRIVRVAFKFFSLNDLTSAVYIDNIRLIK